LFVFFCFVRNIRLNGGVGGGPWVGGPKGGGGGATICHTRKTCGTPLYRVGGPLIHEPIYLRQFVALTQNNR